MNIKAANPITTAQNNITVTRTVRSIAALNFLHFAALGLSAPFINLYLKDIGFSATQIGILISVGAALELIVTPLSNALADRTNRHRTLYYIQNVVMMAATMVMAFTPLRLFLGSAYIAHAVNLRASNESLSQLMLTRLDELKLNIFGKLRLWGSVGWAAMTLASSVVITIGSYPLAFFASSVVRLGMFPFMLALPTQTAGDRTVKPKRRRRGLYVLMLSFFFFHVGFNAIVAFIWIFVQEDLGVPTAQIGLFAAFFAICEFIPMLLIDRVVRRWGTRKVFIVGMAGMVVCWLIYGLLSAAVWLLVLQVFRGVVFTMFVIGSTVIISEISDPANVATNRALIQVTMPALAMLLTSPIAGWLYDTYGAQTTFSIGALMGGVALAVLLLNYRHLVDEPGAAVLP